MAMLNIFGCSHKDHSFPQTPRAGVKVEAAELTGKYVVCTDCGKEFAYDWDKMAVVPNWQKQLRKKREAEAKADNQQVFEVA